VLVKELELVAGDLVDALGPEAAEVVHRVARELALRSGISNPAALTSLRQPSRGSLGAVERVPQRDLREPVATAGWAVLRSKFDPRPS
jgi:hypothetical protein